MSLEPASTRGLCLTGSIAALRRGLYLISAGIAHGPALLPTRSLSPPTADRVGFQYFKGYIASIPKISKVRLQHIFTLHRECLVAFFHNLFPVRSCRCCFKHSNERKQGVVKFTQELVNLTQAKKGAANVKHS